jgi:hypothetical protein
MVLDLEASDLQRLFLDSLIPEFFAISIVVFLYQAVPVPFFVKLGDDNVQGCIWICVQQTCQAAADLIFNAFIAVEQSPAQLVNNGFVIDCRFQGFPPVP